MQAGSAALTHECERVLFAGARSAGTRQQVRAAARGFVRRHRRDVGYLRWVLRTVTASSAVAIALLGLATDPASAGVAPFVQRVGSANPLNGYDAGSYTTPAFGDLDGDGDLDVVAGVLDGTLHYYSNIGTSTIPDFSEFGGIESPFNGVDIGLWSIPTLVDLDADGDLDFMSGDSSGQFFYYKNTGSATSPAFIPQTGAANPLNSGPVGDVGSDSAPSFGDLDGDGDLDVVVGEYDGVFNYFENTGNATAPAFVARTGAANPLDGLDVGLVSIPSLGDIDGDGDLDVVSGEATLGVFLYFENTGNAKSPAFVQRTGSANPFGLSSVATLSTTALGDLDGDGDLDLIAGNRYGLFFYFENRRGTIVLRNGSANPLNGQDVGFDSAPAPGDLDGDGDFDVVAASSTGYFAYYQNTGTAGNPAFFARTGAANPLNGLAGGLYASPAIGDLDGDGDLDLLAGNNGGLFTYLRNTGTATSPAKSTAPPIR